MEKIFRDIFKRFFSVVVVGLESSWFRLKLGFKNKYKTDFK